MFSFDKILENDTSFRRYLSDYPEKPGQVEISNLKLISPNNYPVPIDLSFIFTEIQITENIFSPYVDGFIRIVDAIGLWERIPILGDEYFHITFKSKGSDSNIDEINKLFRVVKVTDFNQDPNNPRTYIYTLHFKSVEYIFNLKTKVQKSYSFKSTKDMVSDIYENYVRKNIDVGWTKDFAKECFLEETSGEYNISIPGMSPFDAFAFLASRSRSTELNSKGASFSFFETLKYGYQFKSLETLMQAPAKFKYFYAPTNLPGNDWFKKFIHECHNIDEYNRTSSIEVDKNLTNGMYGNRMIAHNMLRMRYDIHDLHYSDYIEREHSARVIDSDTGAIVTEDDIQIPNDFANNTLKIEAPSIDTKHADFFTFSNNNVVSTGSDLVDNSQMANVSLVSSNFGCRNKFAIDSKDNNFVRDMSIRDNNIEHWFSRRKMQSHLLNSFIYNIKVKGNTSRSIGDVIYLDIPSALNEETSSASQISSGSPINSMVSSNFLVTRLSHVFTRDQAGTEHTMDMHIMRDSLMKKLPDPYTGDDDIIMGDD